MRLNHAKAPLVLSLLLFMLFFCLTGECEGANTSQSTIAPPQAPSLPDSELYQPVFQTLDLTYPELYQRNCYTPYEAVCSFACDLYPNSSSTDFELFALVGMKEFRSAPFQQFYTDADKTEYHYYRYDFIHRNILDISFCVFVSQDGLHLYGTGGDWVNWLHLANQLPVSYQDALDMTEEIYHNLVTEKKADRDRFVDRFGTEYIEFDKLVPMILIKSASADHPYWSVTMLQPMHQQYSDVNSADYMNRWLTVEIDGHSGEVLSVDSEDLFRVDNYPWLADAQPADYEEPLIGFDSYEALDAYNRSQQSQEESSD